jgi:hypothetical protein
MKDDDKIYYLFVEKDNSLQSSQFQYVLPGACQILHDVFKKKYIFYFNGKKNLKVW